MTPAVEGALRPGDDPRTEARRLRAVRDVVLAGGQPASAPRGVIVESWARVRRHGLDPSGPPDVSPFDGVELCRRREASGLGDLMPLLRQRLLPSADAAGQVMVVVDPSGRVLWREGVTGVRRRADTLGFVEGSAWDEPNVGTNAIGTSLVVGQAVQVFAGEHYAESHQPWTCAAAPLHDPVTGRLLGAVDLSGPAHTVHASTLALVDAVARLVELEVRASHEQRHTGLRLLAGPLLARVAGRALVVAADGCTAGAVGLVAPAHVPLGAGLRDGVQAVPGLGPCAVEALPGGWLIRLDEQGPTGGPTRVVLDLRDVPRLLVDTGTGGWTQDLSPRHAEILLALARHPGGRSARELAADLFADPSRTVTVRAEVSRLRRTVGSLLGQRPYRIASGVDVEVLPPADAAALLPGSLAPVVTAARTHPR